MMIKVCYLGDLPSRGCNAESGVPKVSETLLREFENFPNLEVNAVHLVDSLPAQVIETRGSVRYHYQPCAPRGKAATAYVRQTSRLRRVISIHSPDIVHGQPPTYGLLAAVSCGRPSVLTVHGLVARETKGMARFSFEYCRSRVDDYLQRRAFRKATDIISISPYVETYLKNDVQASARIWNIPNPIDSEFFTISPVRDFALRILCVGTLSIRKNQALLVAACAKLHQLQIPFSCRLVGNATSGMAEGLASLIERSSLTEAITVTGVVSNEELLRHYAWSSVVVLPSLEETAPLSLIQGMAAGRVLAGTNSAGIPYLLEHGRLGMLFENSPSALASCLKHILAQPERMLEKAINAATHARELYHPRGVACSTVKLYEHIINSSHNLV